MYSDIQSIVLEGIHAKAIQIETFISKGMPYYSIVGLPNRVIQESKDRVKSAIKNSGGNFPYDKIVQNMSPAHVKKEGSHLDLPIAVGILSALENFDHLLLNVGIIGELALDGEIKPILGVISLIEGLVSKGIKKIILPQIHLNEVYSFDNVEYYGYSCLKNLLDDLRKGQLKVSDVKREKIKWYTPKNIDFQEVCGQSLAKRVAMISAVGEHHFLMVGTPGCGKTMIAERMATLLPRPSYEEEKTILKIKMLDTYQHEGKMMRPFFSPHHTCTKVSMVGGGNDLKPGLVTKCHGGILLLDEINQFKVDVLEALREPLVNHSITLSRQNQSLTYPAKFILVATMNPCPCGKFFSKTEECYCTVYEVKKHLKRLSAPLIDRFEMIIFLDKPMVTGLMFNQNNQLTSEEMKGKVEGARSFLEKKGWTLPVTNEVKEKLTDYYNEGKISMRRHRHLLKVSESIAALETSPKIELEHLLEALMYQNTNGLRGEL